MFGIGPSSGLRAVGVAFAVLLFSIHTLCSAAEPYCFDEHEYVPGDFACGYLSSVCCATGWACLENGLCLDPDTMEYAVGTCQDRDASTCLKQCEGEWSFLVENSQPHGY